MADLFLLRMRGKYLLGSAVQQQAWRWPRQSVDFGLSFAPRRGSLLLSPKGTEREPACLEILGN